MATESMSDRREHVRSISVTVLAAFAGVGAAFGSAMVTADVADVDVAATEPLTYLIVLTAILVQFPLLTKTGIYTDEEFGIKHYLFITFMTFSMWYVTWGIMLTTGVTF